MSNPMEKGPVPIEKASTEKKITIENTKNMSFDEATKKQNEITLQLFKTLTNSIRNAPEEEAITIFERSTNIKNYIENINSMNPSEQLMKDKSAKKPGDWNTEEFGEWESPIQQQQKELEDALRHIGAENTDCNVKELLILQLRSGNYSF